MKKQDTLNAAAEAELKTARIEATQAEFLQSSVEKGAVALAIANEGVNAIMESFSKAVTMKRLEGIQDSYCALHAIDNFMLSVNTFTMSYEPKQDDWIVANKFTDDHDTEPVAARIDLHMPERHYVQQRIVLKPALPEDDVISVSSSKRRTRITKKSLNKLGSKKNSRNV